MHGLQPSGELTIDQGAHKALCGGNSLLPAGVTQIEGDFNRGDVVIIRTSDGNEIARGLVAYNHHDADRIKGKKTVEIDKILRYTGRTAMVHRSDLVQS